MDVDWLGLIPSAMMTVATVAAAYAALVSLRVSREANLISKQSILAAHHGSAAFEISNAITEIESHTKEFSDLCYSMWADWPRQIQVYDCRSAGGVNPRPLRHVLANASQMLVFHATSNGKDYGRAQRSMYSIIRDGITLSDSEYERLLRKADDTYVDFEDTFGPPLSRKPISESEAFKWACFQLQRRIDTEIWKEIWSGAWQDEGWIGRYRNEYLKIQPVLHAARTSLQYEKR